MSTDTNTPAGTVIITRSSSIEKSYENKAWNNSSFVEAIKEALEEGEANSNNDRYAILQELFNYLLITSTKYCEFGRGTLKIQANPTDEKRGYRRFSNLFGEIMMKTKDIFGLNI